MYLDQHCNSHENITSLTCTVDSISLKANIARTLKATKGVTAGGIFMTVVQLSCTLINICNDQNMYTCPVVGRQNSSALYNQVAQTPINYKITTPSS